MDPILYLAIAENAFVGDEESLQAYKRACEGRREVTVGVSGVDDLMQDLPSVWDRYLLGSAYYPKWWPQAEWEIDFRQMQRLGLNTVRVGEFAWSRFEPA